MDSTFFRNFTLCVSNRYISLVQNCFDIVIAYFGNSERGGVAADAWRWLLSIGCTGTPLTELPAILPHPPTVSPLPPPSPAARADDGISFLVMSQYCLWKDILTCPAVL
ncbi:unnamed protein product [Arctia plantaginis]|uniref:Uncharacterized protein n=1 Tax=Arctia plantaginis TaxID=874455 RepID=A0A8S1A0M8_ARCPL|nr:unnamed protein product [Arctia plantaginis]